MAAGYAPAASLTETRNNTEEQLCMII